MKVFHNEGLNESLQGIKTLKTSFPFNLVENHTCEASNFVKQSH